MKSGIFEIDFSKKPLLYFPFLLLIFLLFGCAALPELDQPRTDRIARGPEYSPFYGLKRRVAVLDFENRTDHGGKKLGSAVSDMLITQLARSNRFVLIERSRIEKILHEQALGQSGAVTEETAPQVGQLLGVESLILGRILKADQETGSHKIENEKDKWKFRLKATLGIAQISYKIVNTTTGEILLANEVATTEIKPGVGIKTKKFDFENMFNFDQTVLGLAIRKAVNTIAQDIVDNIEIIDWIGKIIQSQADTSVYFTPGRGSGIQLDQLFDIYESIDFHNEEELPTEDSFNVNQPKARVKVSGFIGDKVARAKVIQGKNIKKGDLVKIVKRRSPSNNIE